MDDELTGLNQRLFKAIENDDEERMMKVISEGADMNALDDTGWTPLMTSVHRYLETDLACFKRLLKLGASQNSHTIIPWAAALGNPQAIRIAVSMGHDVNEHDGWGKSGLSYAAEDCHLECAMVLTELNANWDLPETGRGHETPRSRLLNPMKTATVGRPALLAYLKMLDEQKMLNSELSKKESVMSPSKKRML